MNAHPLLGRCLVALTLALGAAGALPSRASAAPSAPVQLVAAAPRPVLTAQTTRFGGILQDVVGNRTRLIQVSFVCIIIGIMILWKK